MKKGEFWKIALYAIIASAITSGLIALICLLTKPPVIDGKTKQVTITYTYMPENDLTRKDK